MVESRCCGDTTASPEWRKTFHVPVAVAQWSRSHLKLEVWNREAFLTDDFLGHVVLPLKDMLPEVCVPHLSIRCYLLVVVVARFDGDLIERFMSGGDTKRKIAVLYIYSCHEFVIAEHDFISSVRFVFVRVCAYMHLGLG